MSSTLSAIMPEADQIVTTTELCQHFRITGHQFAHLRDRGGWSVQPEIGRKLTGKQGGEKQWSLEAAKLSAPECLSVHVGEPATRIPRNDGSYIWIVLAAGMYDEAAGKHTRATPGKLPNTQTMLRWIEDRCELLVEYDKKGKPFHPKLRGFTLKYRKSAASLRVDERTYIHEAQLEAALKVRRGLPRQEKPGDIGTSRARRVLGVGYRTFKAFIEDEKECTRLIGHPAAWDLRVIVGKSARTTKTEKTWLEQHIHDIAKAFKQGAAEFAGWHQEKEFRRQYRKQHGTKALPTTKFSLFETTCRSSLPGGPRHQISGLGRHSSREGRRQARKLSPGEGV